MSSWEAIENIMAQSRKTWVRKFAFLAALKPISLYSLGKALEKMNITDKKTAITIASELTKKKLGKIELEEPILKVVRIEKTNGRLRKIVESNIEYILKVFLEDMAEAPSLYEDFLTALNEWKEKIVVGKKEVPKEVTAIAKAIDFLGLFATILLSSVHHSKKLSEEKKRQLSRVVVNTVYNYYIGKPRKLMNLIMALDKTRETPLPEEFFQILFNLIERTKK